MMMRLMPRLFLSAAALGLAAALILLSASLEAREYREAPLTQADIDAYIFLAPRLLGDIMRYPDQAAKILDEAKVTRRRAIYITAKIPLTQALARGLISPASLVYVPARLHPTTEEVQLINANLKTLMQAEGAVIDAARVSVPRVMREAPRP